MFVKTFHKYMNRVTELLGIKYPIVQAGMVWCSGWKLAHAVSKSGGLGVIGAGSMYPEVLEEHIQKYKAASNAPFGVNVPLMMNRAQENIEIIIREKVPIAITSAGSPQKATKMLQDAGIKVLHVVANTKFAIKCEEAGVDGIIAEGFEAGGHNGREETTTLTLVPLIRKVTDLPLIAAGGIYDAKTMLSAMILGAEGVQIGSRFAVAKESSAHENYKQRVLEAIEGDTVLTLKKLAPVRLIKNSFQQQVLEAENTGASITELIKLLGKGRAKKAIFDGDLDEGEIEIGQVSALLQKNETASEIMNEIVNEFNTLKNNIFTENKFQF
jgi:enoyl-[acyl-carrier protein] reductase II